jgi:hypothetical protein
MTPTNPLAPLLEQVQRPPQEPHGIVYQMPASVYHGLPQLSKSKLDVFHKVPLDFLDAQLGRLKRTTTPEMELGSLMHSVILEDRHDYVVRPETYTANGIEKPWNGNATVCREWVMEHEHKTILSQDQRVYLLRCRDLVQNDPRCRELLSDAVGFEVSAFCKHDLIVEGLKSRMDVLCVSRILDLKTTNDASTAECSRTINRYRYHVQAAFYLDVAERCGLKLDGFSFIFLQKTDPPRLNVRHLKRSAIELGRMQMEDDIKRLFECRTNGDWPGYSGSDDDGIGEVDLPAWCYTQPQGDTDLDMLFNGVKVGGV